MNGFLQNFGQQIKYILDMRITDILDILIVAYVIYLLSNLIRRTRTYTVFQGILILLGILGLSLGSGESQESDYNEKPFQFKI